MFKKKDATATNSKEKISEKSDFKLILCIN